MVLSFLLKPKRLFEEDFSSGTLGQFSSFGDSNGTISVSGGEVTISNDSGNSNSFIGIETDVKFPVGTKVIAKAKNTEGRHAAVVGISDPRGQEPYPHAEKNAGPATSIYGRADAPDMVCSLDDDNNNTDSTQLSEDPRNYRVVEIVRPDSSTVEYYIDGELVETYSGITFTQDCRLYFSADGYSNPCTVVIDEVIVTEIDTSSDDARYGLTSDTSSEGGVLDADNYSVSHTSPGTTAAGAFAEQDGGVSSTTTPSGTTASAALADQGGAGTTSSDAAGGTEPFVASDRTASPSTSTIAAAIHELFTGSTFANASSSATAVGGDAATATIEIQGTSDTSATAGGTTAAAALTEQLGSLSTASTTVVGRVLAAATDQGGTASTSSTVSAARGVGSASEQTASPSTETAVVASNATAAFSRRTGTPSTVTAAGAFVQTQTFDGDVSQPTAAANPTATAPYALTTDLGATAASIADVQAAVATALTDPTISADTFGSRLAEALTTSASASPLVGVGDTAVVGLGQITSTSISAIPSAGVNLGATAVATPPTAAGSGLAATSDTSVNAVALTENAVYTPLSPTLGLVINVEKGGIGLEGTFADSLTADVGAQTTIKVAKTVANATEFLADGTTSTTGDAVRTAAALGGLTGSFTTSATAEAVTTLALLEGISEEHTATDVIAGLQAANTTEQTAAESSSAATAEGALPTGALDALDAAGETATTAEALREAVVATMQEGAADTQVEAAALVAQAAADRQTATLDTSVGAAGIIESFTSAGKVSQPSTSALVGAIATLAGSSTRNGQMAASTTTGGDTTPYSAESATSDAATVANVAAVASLVSMVYTEGTPDTFADAGGDPALAALDGLDTGALTEALPDGALASLTASDKQADGDTSALVEAAHEAAQSLTDDADADTSADVDAAIEQALTQVRGAGKTSSAADAIGSVASGELTPVQALIRILYVSLRGTNNAVVQNGRNYVEIID